MGVYRKIVGMAFPRKRWVARVEQTYGDFWSNEVRQHLDKIDYLLDPKKTKSKSKFDRIKAFREAFHNVRASSGRGGLSVMACR